jgi:hypothetical protein
MDSQGLLYFDFPETGFQSIFSQPYKALGYNGTANVVAGTFYDTNPGAADGAGPQAHMNFPRGLALGNGHLYVADSGNHAIRDIDLATDVVSTLAGALGVAGDIDGAAADARFREPQGIAFDAGCGAGVLYVSDTGNHLVRRIDVAARMVSTVVGRRGSAGVELGPLPAAVDEPIGVAVTRQGDLIIADRAAGKVLRAVR